MFRDCLFNILMGVMFDYYISNRIEWKSNQCGIEIIREQEPIFISPKVAEQETESGEQEAGNKVLPIFEPGNGPIHHFDYKQAGDEPKSRIVNQKCPGPLSDKSLQQWHPITVYRVVPQQAESDPDAPGQYGIDQIGQ